MPNNGGKQATAAPPDHACSVSEAHLGDAAGLFANENLLQRGEKALVHLVHLLFRKHFDLLDARHRRLQQAQREEDLACRGAGASCLQVCCQPCLCSLTMYGNHDAGQQGFMLCRELSSVGGATLLIADSAAWWLHIMNNNA